MEQKKHLEFVFPTWGEMPDIELYMDQVISVLDRYLAPLYPEEEKRITSTMINNYVKQKLLPPPENKRYGKKHLVYLFIISVLKRFMQLSDISLVVQNLILEFGEEGAYALFTSELSAALVGLFDEGESLPLQKGKTPRVVRTCCEAFAAILYSRSVFVSAGFQPVEEVEEVKEKEKKEKSKEKKETKEKKKEPKEKANKEEK